MRLRLALLLLVWRALAAQVVEGTVTSAGEATEVGLKVTERR